MVRSCAGDGGFTIASVAMPTRPAPAPPSNAPTAAAGAGGAHGSDARRRLHRLFLEGFTAADVAEPLVSFDAERGAGEVRAFLDARGFDLVGVRVDGLVRGYAERAALTGGRCGDHLHPPRARGGPPRLPPALGPRPAPAGGPRRR
jgi:hypothetical protein